MQPNTSEIEGDTTYLVSKTYVDTYNAVKEDLRANAFIADSLWMKLIDEIILSNGLREELVVADQQIRNEREKTASKQRSLDSCEKEKKKQGKKLKRKKILDAIIYPVLAIETIILAVQNL